MAAMPAVSAMPTIRGRIHSHFSYNPSIMSHLDSTQSDNLIRSVAFRVIEHSARLITRNMFNTRTNVIFAKYKCDEMYSKQKVRDLLEDLQSNTYFLLTLKYFVYSVAFDFRHVYGNRPLTRDECRTQQHQTLYQLVLSKTKSYGIHRDDAKLVFSYITRIWRTKSDMAEAYQKSHSSRPVSVSAKTSRSSFAALFEKYSSKTFSSFAIERINHYYNQHIHSVIHGVVKTYVRRKLRFIPMFYSGVSASDLENDLLVRVLTVYYNMQPCDYKESHLIAYLCRTVRDYSVNIIEKHTAKKRAAVETPEVINEKGEKEYKAHIRVCISDGIAPSNRGGKEYDYNDGAGLDNTLSDMQGMADHNTNKIYGLTEQDYAILELQAIVDKYKREHEESSKAFYESVLNYVSVPPRTQDASPLRKQYGKLRTLSNVTYGKYCLARTALVYNEDFTRYLIDTGVISENETNLDLAYRFALPTILHKAASFLQIRGTAVTSLKADLANMSQHEG